MTIALGGCRAEPGPAIDPYESTLLGVYTIESWTENRGSCEVEGPSLLDSRPERFALVQACTDPYSGLHVAPCDDVTACQAEACDASFFSVFPDGWPNLDGNDHDGWYGRSLRAPMYAGDHCEAIVQEAHVTVEGGVLTVRSEVLEAASYPLQNGECPIDEDAYAAAGEKPCGTLEVLRIRREHADCDPLASSACPDDERCIPFGRRFLCLPAAGAPGQQGDPCEVDTCAPGLICLDAEYLTGCATSCCTDLCDAGAADRDQQCDRQADGYLCRPYYSEFSEQPGREDVGVCLHVLVCDDNEEIPWEYVCDGASDCDDGKDESDC